MSLRPRRILPFVIVALVSGVAVAQVTESPIETLFRKNPLRAVFDMTITTSNQVSAVQTEVQAVNDNVSGVGGMVADIIALDPVVELSCENAVATVTTCRGTTCDDVRYPCAPYGCDADGRTCRQECNYRMDCATGHECNRSTHQCVPVSYSCGSDPFTLQRSDGVEASCSPYRCLMGSCQQQCVDNSGCDTAAGFQCVDSRCVR